MPDQVFVIGGSFGGAAAILASLDSRIDKAIANCPVVDWRILRNAYRLSDRDWNKVRRGAFFNPVQHVAKITPSKVLIFHAKDDPYVPWKKVDRFARRTGVKLHLLARGGHLRTDHVVQRFWPRIAKFLAD